MPPIYLLDTNMVSAIMADHPKVQARMSGQAGRIVTCPIVCGEIRYGLERLPAGKRRSNLEAKAALVLAAIAIEPVTKNAGDTYGVVRRAMELKGRNPDDNDLWIAALSLVLGATLVSNDQEFSHVPGLVVEDWTV
jgi:predicted nucleic acid-binding protein